MFRQGVVAGLTLKAHYRNRAIRKNYRSGSWRNATTITPSEADAVREGRLARRRPSLYNPLLALRRAPVDSTATHTRRSVTLAAAQWPLGPSRLSTSQPRAHELLVLPELSALSTGLSAEQIAQRAELRGGAFETKLTAQAKAGNGCQVGSYPERDGSRVFHTVVLPGPAGTVLGRYRATHLTTAEQDWATPGDAPVVIPTPLGRIGLATVGDLVSRPGDLRTKSLQLLQD